ncbi:MAG: uncharacterized protein JWN52_6225 [Actinomycetia bacterium]|nr:uncharacterized protein [Actinomycetes bacterium]
MTSTLSVRSQSRQSLTWISRIWTSQPGWRARKVSATSRTSWPAAALTKPTRSTPSMPRPAAIAFSRPSDGDTARLTAIVEAQHLLKADHSRHALLKNLYAVDLIRDGERWVMRRVLIDNVWYTGDPQVIFRG